MEREARNKGIANFPEKGGELNRSAQRGSLSLEDYAALSHVLVSPRGEGPGLVDQALAQRGLVRRIALRIPHFYTALAIVARSDLILTAPAALSQLVSDHLPVVALPAPLRLPQHTVNLTWHERFSKDQGHAWLRRLVAEVARAASSSPHASSIAKSATPAEGEFSLYSSSTRSSISRSRGERAR